MSQKPESIGTRWSPILFLSTAGLLLFVLPMILPWVILTMSEMSQQKPTNYSGPNLALLSGVSVLILESLWIREMAFRRGGWGEFVSISLALFVLHSFILAPPINTIEDSTVTGSLDSLLVAVSANPNPQTFWWLLPWDFSQFLVMMAFLISFTELYFPHERMRPWLSSWQCGICFAVMVPVYFFRFLEQATTVLLKTTLLAFSWQQAVVGAALVVGLLWSSRRNSSLSMTTKSGNERSPSPALCMVTAFAVICGLHFFALLETFLAAFSGAYTFQNPLARMFRAICDVLLLRTSVRILRMNTHRKTWSDKQLIGLLLGGYAAIQLASVFKAIQAGLPDLVVWASLIINLASLFFLSFLLHWIWHHGPQTHPGKSLPTSLSSQDAAGFQDAAGPDAESAG